MPKPTPLDPTEAHIIANATRFFVTVPSDVYRPHRLLFQGTSTEQRLMKCYHFTFSEACDYARWLQKLTPVTADRCLVYAAQCDHPDAPSAAQQWRSVLVPKEHWL